MDTRTITPNKLDFLKSLTIDENTVPTNFRKIFSDDTTIDCQKMIEIYKLFYKYAGLSSAAFLNHQNPDYRPHALVSVKIGDEIKKLKNINDAKVMMENIVNIIITQINHIKNSSSIKGGKDPQLDGQFGRLCVEVVDFVEKWAKTYSDDNAKINSVPTNSLVKKK